MEKGILKLNNPLVLGIDIGMENVQISYSVGNDDPVSASLIPGSELYQIPLCLYKPADDNWLFGTEAKRRAERDNRIPYTGLLQALYDQQTFMVGGEEIPAIELLSLFVRRALSILPKGIIASRASVTVITAEDCSEDRRKLLEGLTGRLKLEASKVFIITRKEAVYSYIVHQTAALWSKDVLVLSGRNGKLSAYHFTLNRKSNPNIGTVSENTFRVSDVTSLNGALTSILEDRDFGTVYLIGDSPLGEWDTEQLRLICRNRRAFQGNNLFSLGCAFVALSKQRGGDKAIVYLGEDMLQENILLEVAYGVRRTYVSFLDGGIPLGEAESVEELYLNEARSLRFQRVHLNGETGPVPILLQFPELPEREGYSSRIRLWVRADQKGRILVRVKDLGMGEFFPSTGMVIERELPLTSNDSAISEEIPAPRLSMGKYADLPYEEKRTRMKLYCLEELARLIQKSASLLDESLMSEDLIRWISVKLGLEELAGELRVLLQRKGLLSEFAKKIMTAAGIPVEEQNRSLTILMEYSGKNPFERKKDHALQTAQKGQYTAAYRELNELFTEVPPEKIALRSSILHDMGVLEAQSFRFQAAADLFYRAYELDRDRESWLACLAARRLALPEEEYVSMAADLGSNEDVMEVEGKFKDAEEQWIASEERRKLDRLSELSLKGNSILYYEEFSRLIENLRTEYREAME